jgi:hypothetical protein
MRPSRWTTLVFNAARYNSGNWTAYTTLIISGADYSNIGFHDAGSRVDFIRCGAGVMELGHNGGFGNATIQVLANMGVGTAPAVSNRLYVKGVDSTSSNGALIVQNSSGTTLMQNRDDGYAQVSAAWTVVSDESTKDEIDVLPDGLDAVKLLKPKKYRTKLGEHKTFGLLAQDVQEVFPDMVSVTTDGVLGLRYNDLIPVLINAVNELEGQVSTLKDELAKMKTTKSA